ncbi:MAG: amidohydrolase [Betaproteobacteria bacterium]|nr:amidohydrolase [Betaproteobacteria bacterium]
MASLLIKGALGALTGEASPAARLPAVDVRVAGGLIEEIAPALQARPGESVLNADGCVLYPGLVNTHHHMFQSLLKGVPAGINEGLGLWLRGVHLPRLPIFDEEMVRVGATLALVQMALSGATTVADHYYLHHAGAAGVLFEAAEQLGLRLVLCRGAVTVKSANPDYPDIVPPVSFDAMLRDIDDLAARYHDPSADSRRRVAVAPLTPTYSVTPAELTELARFARAKGLRMHTHLSETLDYISYTREKHDCLPVQFMAEHEWLGRDVWLAHMVHLAPEEVAMVAASGTGIAHCPTSNARLGSGIAPLPAYTQAGVSVSLGVDGPACSEASHMLDEARMAWLIHRAASGPKSTTVENIVHAATRAGAVNLGLDNVGLLKPGMAADLVAFELEGPAYWGQHDALAAPLITGHARVRHSLVGGRAVVRDGLLPAIDLEKLRHDAAAAVAKLH